MAAYISRSRREPAVNTIGTTPSASRISPLNERIYHQSNLLGDWKGSFSQNHQPVEVKVVSITGNTAQVEYTHNGQTERSSATVDKNSITFGNLTIATRNGTKAALVFAFGTVRQTAMSMGRAARVSATSSIMPSFSASCSSHPPMD
jgi:hypothetical protein